MFLILQVLVSCSPALTLAKSGRVTSARNSNLLHSTIDVFVGVMVEVAVFDGVIVGVDVFDGVIVNVGV